MKTLKVNIQGTSPLLMHAYKGNDNPELRHATPQEQAEFGVYRSATGELIFPTENFHRAFISGANYVKKGLGRKISGAAIIQEPEMLLDSQEYIVDSRGVVVMKNRIVRHRARLNSWGGAFTIEYDPSLITEKELRSVVEKTGQLVGVGDFRPEKKGPFGRFTAEF